MGLLLNVLMSCYLYSLLLLILLRLSIYLRKWQFQKYFKTLQFSSSLISAKTLGNADFFSVECTKTTCPAIILFLSAQACNENLKSKLEVISVRIGRNLRHDIATSFRSVSAPQAQGVAYLSSFHKLVKKSCRVMGVKVFTLFHPGVPCISSIFL